MMKKKIMYKRKRMMKYIVIALVWFTIAWCDSKTQQGDVNVSEPITSTTPVVNTDNGDGGTNPTDVSDDSKDIIPPVITIRGDNHVKLIQFSGLYHDLGADALDNKDGNIEVVVEINGDIDGEVDELVAGDYNVTYIATDKAGNIASKVRIVTVEKYDDERVMAEVSAILHDESVPYSTLEDWKKTGYYKARQNMTQEDYDRERRSERAYDLLDIAIDPDEEWWETDVNDTRLFRNAGEVFTLKVSKEDSEGTLVGLVENEKLRFVVRIQTIDNTFIYINNNDINKYVKWIEKGILEIHVPEDMNSGRLLIGLRPSFDNVATVALTERRSILIEAEVLEVKSGVISPNYSNILLPPKKTEGISLKEIFEKTKFNQKEVLEKSEILFKKGIFNRPMILENMTVEKGDFIAHIHQGLLYSGKVIELYKRGNEQLIFLALNIKDVYNQVDKITSGLMVKHGLVPEFSPYRISSDGADEYRSDRNES